MIPRKKDIRETHTQQPQQLLSVLALFHQWSPGVQRNPPNLLGPTNTLVLKVQIFVRWITYLRRWVHVRLADLRSMVYR